MGEETINQTVSELIMGKLTLNPDGIVCLIMKAFPEEKSERDKLLLLLILKELVKKEWKNFNEVAETLRYSKTPIDGYWIDYLLRRL